MRIPLTKYTGLVMHINEAHILNELDQVGGIPEYRPLILEANYDQFEEIMLDNQTQNYISKS